VCLHFWNVPRIFVDIDDDGAGCWDMGIFAVGAKEIITAVMLS
ncbi:uncharacterized protein METZ01_LOCUS382877, partial [marine metagenome]